MISSLERASIDADIRPFANFIAERVNWSLDRVRRRTRSSDQFTRSAMKFANGRMSASMLARSSELIMMYRYKQNMSYDVKQIRLCNCKLIML